MLAIYIMKAILILICTGFLVAGVVRIFSRNRDWLDIVFYLFLAAVALFVYYWNFHNWLGL